MPKPRTESATWIEFTAVCITCRRLRKRAGTFPDQPAVIAHSRDHDAVITAARQHETLGLARDEGHAIEIHARRVTVEPLTVDHLGDIARP